MLRAVVLYESKSEPPELHELLKGSDQVETPFDEGRVREELPETITPSPFVLRDDEIDIGPSISERGDVDTFVLRVKEPMPSLLSWHESLICPSHLSYNVSASETLSALLRSDTSPNMCFAPGQFEDMNESFVALNRNKRVSNPQIEALPLDIGIKAVSSTSKKMKFQNDTEVYVLFTEFGPAYFPLNKDARDLTAAE